MKKSSWCFLLVFVFTGIMPAQPSRPSSPAGSLMLAKGWTLQSSSKVESDGATLSSPDFQPKGWYSVDVPTTVVASMVKNKVYPDPFFGMNMRSFPGVTYGIGENFSNIPMRPDSPFAVPWWYRKQFEIPASFKGKTIWLKFGGINYRANIWLNGKQIANSNDVAGAWRTYEFNVTDVAKPGAVNVLAVQVFAPTETDLAITFVDWNPAPPDKNMGLWREVELVASGPVALRYPTVVSKVDSPANDKAHLTVTALLKNGSKDPVKGVLKGRIGALAFSQNVELSANESKDVTFTPEQFSQLNFDKPRLWWPVQMGKPELYELNLEFAVGNAVSDKSSTQFGIREITSQVLSPNRRLFSVNGKNILIRGGGWTTDMMLRQDPQRLRDEFKYVEDMGLNTIRLEGKLETEDFFNLADQRGILVMAGWCCCDFWEQWDKWQPEHHQIAQQSLRDQIYRLRSHPSLVMWLNGSDNPPPSDVEQAYLNIEKELLWPNPVVSSATSKLAQYSGPSGSKMTGPYEYVAPSYWQTDKPEDNHECNNGGCGGGYGFNTETSMGPAVPPIESLIAMVGKDHLWPRDDFWNYHVGGEQFKDMHVFSDALDARYGKANSAEDFAEKSQLMTYEGVRAMFEAYSRNKYQSTGVIQWMLNNAWPSLIWHLYDYYLRPGGGYFGAKAAMEPLHPIYGYDDHSIWVVSSTYKDVKGLKLTAKVLNLDMTEKFSKEVDVDAAADSTTKVITLPEIADLSPTYFVVLRLQDSAGKLVGSNFYWLSTKPETIDWAKSQWYVTPTATYADFTALSQLPKVKLKVLSRTERKGEEAVTHVTIENPSKSLAFFVRLKVNQPRTVGQFSKTAKNGTVFDGFTTESSEILPVIWEDNYFSLLPGEKREVSATYRPVGAVAATVQVSGWNAQ